MTDMHTDLHRVLVALGDGGTREMAERVMPVVADLASVRIAERDDEAGAAAAAYAVAAEGDEPRMVDARYLVAAYELRELFDRPTNVITNWASRPQYRFPAPVRKLKAVALYDVREVLAWAERRPDLVRGRTSQALVGAVTRARNAEAAGQVPEQDPRP